MLKNIIEESKDYLIKYHEKHFDDKTFHAYISNRLAGDFAVELTKALRKEVELQEEMITKCIKVFSSKTGKMDEFIKIKGEAIEVIEKYYNKKWKEIIK